jgi:hypothetical protein
MRCRLLHIPQEHHGIKRRDDKRMPERTRPAALVIPASATRPDGRSSGAVPVVELHNAGRWPGRRRVFVYADLVDGENSGGGGAPSGAVR